MNEPANNYSRREFIKRLMATGLSLSAASSLAYYFYDPNPPKPPGSDITTVTLPDFSIPDMKGQMAVVSGADRRRNLNIAAKAIGGMEAFIESGDQVLIKVNAAFATPPHLGATTHPDLVEELVKLCLTAGAKKVIVTDNPINDPASCFSFSGIENAANAAGAEVILPQPSFFKPVNFSQAQLLRAWPLLFAPFAGVNKLIGVAPVKDHHRSGASLSLKNWYGLLGGRRNIFHQDIHNLIKELAIMVKPTLVILDGTVSMMQNGPTGGSLNDLKQTNTLIVSTDHVAADAFAAALLDKKPEGLPFIGLAAAAGAGKADLSLIDLKREDAS